jgi:hypothetical protein
VKAARRSRYGPIVARTISVSGARSRLLTLGSRDWIGPRGCCRVLIRWRPRNDAGGVRITGGGRGARRWLWQMDELNQGRSTARRVLIDRRDGPTVTR